MRTGRRENLLVTKGERERTDAFCSELLSSLYADAASRTHARNETISCLWRLVPMGFPWGSMVLEGCPWGGAVVSVQLFGEA